MNLAGESHIPGFDCPELMVGMHILKRLGGKPGWLLLVALSGLAPQVGAQSAASPEAKPGGSQPRVVSEAPVVISSNLPPLWALAAPKPAPVKRAELADAFTKAAPASIADLKAMERHVQSLVARVSPAVVAVEVGNASGSGVIISEDGLVLTAGHVGGAAGRRVLFTFHDGNKALGETIGVETDSDTALMRIRERRPWPHVDVGDLAEARPGDWVLALGHPGGFDPKRSLVVRLGRIVRMMPEVLQTDCTISPGDSGGPLFDMYGRVIAIHSAISSSLAENFHVPVTEFYQNWKELVKAESRRWGIPAQILAGAIAVDDAAGCRLSKVEPNSPASKAGLEAGDLVLKVEGREIKASASFRRWLEEAAAGETLNLEVKRANQLLSLQLKLQGAAHQD